MFDFSMLHQNEFQQRRNKLLAQMGDGIAIIPTAPEAIRNRDSHYPYRFDSYFSPNPKPQTPNPGFKFWVSIILGKNGSGLREHG